MFHYSFDVPFLPFYASILLWGSGGGDGWEMRFVGCKCKYSNFLAERELRTWLARFAETVYSLYLHLFSLVQSASLSLSRPPFWFIFIACSPLEM